MSPLAGLSAEQLDGLSRALAAVAIAVPEQTPPSVASVEPAVPAAPSREELFEPLARALAQKHPLRLEASAKANTLVLVVRGRALPDSADAEADALLREHALPLLCPAADAPADAPVALPGDAVRLVLDLRALAAFPRGAAVALLERWGAFAASRCYGGRIAVVLPCADDCAGELRAAAAETHLAEAFAPLRCAVFSRSRDVAAFMDSP